MRESVIYQEILSRGEQIGEQRERALILRLLTRRAGNCSIIPIQTYSSFSYLGNYLDSIAILPRFLSTLCQSKCSFFFRKS
jgi:hypothetical protein